ncbi:MAG TPA: MBG domain-containing protein [Clostridia bacterium]|nr:MBG domain-containing protein [Clostridia bacterium]
MRKLLLVVLIFAVLLTAIAAAGCNKESVINSIEIFTAPDVVYLPGQSLRLNGAQLLVKYDNSKEELITITEDMVSGYDKNLLGEQYLTIRYKDKIVSLPIRIVPPELVGIDINTQPSKVNYIQGEVFKIDGCKINVDYVGNITEVINVTLDMCNLDEIDMDEVGTQVVTVTYEVNGVVRTATFNIHIEPKVMQSMQITKYPDKKIYYVGEPLDLTGGEIYFSYNNGYPERVDMAELYNNGNGNLAIDWDNTRIAANSTVTLTYTYQNPASYDDETRTFTGTFDVTVTERDIAGVEILSAGNEYRYQLVNTDLNLNGLILKVTYNNGTTEIFSFGGESDPIAAGRIAAEGYRRDVLHNQTIKLVFYYSGVRLKTTYDLSITVANRAPSGVRIIPPVGTIYTSDGIPCFYQDTPINPFKDDTAGIEGWKFVLLYNNGTEGDTEYSLTSPMVRDQGIRNGITFSQVGEYTWYIRYSSQVDNIPFRFNVIPKRVTSATIRFPEGYKTYYGFALNVEGVMLDLVYNNGDAESVYVTPSMVREFSNTTLGEQIVKISYVNSYTGEEGIIAEGVVTLVKKVKENYSIGFRAYPKLEYIRDERLELNNAEIYIQFDEGGIATTDIIVLSQLRNDWQKLPTPLIPGAVTFRNSEGWTITAFGIDDYWRITETGTLDVFISYEGLTAFGNGAGYQIVVTDPVDSIELETYLPNVFVGQDIDLTDIFLRVRYKSGRIELVPVTKDMLDYNPRNLTLGERAVKITYTDPATSLAQELEVTIEVKAKALRSIQILNPPNKREYLYLSNESIDYTGLRLMFNYNNGSSEIVEVTADNADQFIFENFSTDFEDEALEITVMYIAPVERETEDLFDTFTVAVRDVVVSALRWTGTVGAEWPVVTSQEGVPFDMIASIVGYRIEVIYSNGTSDEVDVSAFAPYLDVTGYNPNSAIRQNVFLTYKFNRSVSLKLEITVTPRVLTDIDLIAPRDIEVIENNDIDLTEYKIRLKFDNDTEEIVSMVQQNIIKSAANPGGYDKNDTRVGPRAVTVCYTRNGITCYETTTVIVKAKQLVSIGINTLPKVKYIEGEELDLMGGKVALYYDNGSQEELSLTDATTENFYINRNKFDNNEFSGLAKLQTIYVIYKEAGREFQTQFDIIMQDRRTPVISFEWQHENDYRFVYGDRQAPPFTVYGYGDFYQEDEPNMAFSPARMAHVTVRYINVNEYNNQNPLKDYTELPTEAGTYYIIVSYNADPIGYERDSIHNSFVYVCPYNLVITKRVVYVGVQGIEKIYGTPNPDYRIYILSEEKYHNQNNPNVANKPFAYNDNFFSESFIRLAGDQTNSYDEHNNLVTAFLIRCLDWAGNPVDIKTGVGTYQITLSMGTSVSDNYDIRFIGSFLTINKRNVLVTPLPVNVEYGDRNIVYKYTVSGEPGETDSGLYGTDTLTGSLSRYEPSNYNVGKYAITKGSLDNPNYNIVFINDTVSDGGKNGVYVTIYKRNLYIKVNSKIITYGDPVPTFGSADITLYRDDVCTITEGALAPTDTFQMLLGTTGYLTFSHSLTALADVGRYTLSVNITGVTDSNVITNYEIHYVQGYIEVKQKPVNVTAVHATKIYGDPDPVLTYVVDGDLPSGILLGNVARQQGEHIGNYTITIGTLASANPNYKINFTSATFSITSKALIARIAPEHLTKVFDGKVPGAIPFTVYQIVNGQEVPVSESVDTSFIKISIVDARRDTGSYNLMLENTNANYSVSFPQGANYRYVITKRSVDVEIVIPDSLPYKGSGYVFDAYVPDDQIQRFYNPDGSVMVDENNNEIKDEVQVVLRFTTGTTAVFVGEYEIYVSALISQNDNYQVNGMISRKFSITPRELIVTINPELIAYDNTIVVDFNDRDAAIKQSDYTLGNTIPGSTDNINFSFRIISEAHNLDRARNVIFNPDGSIGSYDIKVVQPTNPNYTVSLAAQYKYKILPRSAKIRIANNFLSKKYDGRAPEIVDFSKVATLAKSDVVFTFTRDTNDGRPLGDVGVYNISVSSKDPNHTVYLEAAYQFTITKAPVTVSPKKDTKTYDGQPIGVAFQDLAVSSMPRDSIIPVIRSFAARPIYDGNGNITGYTDVAEVYADFQFVMGQLITMFTRNIEKANSIVFIDMSLAMLRVNETISVLQESQNYLEENSWVINSPANLSAVIQNLIDARFDLGRISPTAPQAQNENNLYNATQKILAAHRKIEEENTYIAFLFRPVSGTGADPTSTNAGNYTFEVRQNDFNKDYIYNSTIYSYKVLPKEVYLGVKTYQKMYGQISANPEQGSPDYYEYETKVLVDGEFVTMVLPNFNPRFTRSDASNFNVGVYSIIYLPDPLLDNNYIIVEDRLNYSWEFQITPATVVLQIEDTGYGQDKVYYGTRITNMIVDRWSYVSGLAPADLALVTSGGQVSVDLLKLHIISTANVYYTAGKIAEDGSIGYDVIASTESKPSAGEYFVTGDGFSARNYVFEVLPGKLKISKAPISIMTDFDGNVTRIYGDPLVLTFIGLKYDDYINISFNASGNYQYNVSLGEGDSGNFTMPLFKYNPADNPTGINPYALTAPVTSQNRYIVYFEWTEAQAAALNNYEMTNIVDGSGNPVEYGMLVTRATLNFTIRDAANPSQYPTTIYGEVPSVVYQYSGFKNGESKASLGFADPDCSTLRLRNVWDEYKAITMQDLVFTEESMNKLANYNLVLDPNAQLTVTKRTLYVYINKPISVRYENGVSITPYIVRNPDLDELDSTDYRVLAGQYGPWDIAFSNRPYNGTADPKAGLANGETPLDVFKAYIIDDGFLTYETITVGGNQIKLVATFYPFYDMMVKHSLVYEQRIGENMTLKLDGLQFATEGQNYNIVYSQTPLNVYGRLDRFEMDTDRILLENNNINDMSVIAVFEDGTRKNYTIGELKALSNTTVTTSAFPANKNRNTEIEILFNRTYSLSELSASSYIYGGESYNLTLHDSFPRNFSNGNTQSVVVTRVYDRYNPSAEEPMPVTFNNYTYRTPIYAVSNTEESPFAVIANNKDYDYLDTTIRMVPGAASHGFSIAFAGGVVSGKSSLVFRGNNDGTYQIVMANPSKTFNINIGTANLFDGYSHNITIYFNRLLKMVYISIDGYACGAISVADFASDDNEQNLQRVSFYGVQAWMRHFVTGYRGYYDNIATQVKAVANMPLTYFIAEGTSVSIPVTGILASSGVPAGSADPGYTNRYYVNGVEVSGGIHTFGHGTHKVEMAIFNGGAVVHRYSVTVLVTYASETASVTKITGGTSTTIASGVTPSKPVSVKSFTPNAESDDKIDNAIQEFHTFGINGSTSGFTSVTLSLSMVVALMATTNEYRSNPNAKSFVVLWGNDTDRAPGYSVNAGYYGIGLSYEFDATNQYESTRLNIAFGTTQYYEQIPDINWLSGNEYTISLYVDKKNANDYGTTRMKLIIYQDTAIIYSITIGEGTQMMSGSTPATITKAQMTNLISATAKTYIISADTRINIRRAEFNAENRITNDYIVDGYFTQSAYGGLDFAGNSSAYIANNLGSYGLNRLGESSVKFKFSGSAQVDSVNFRFIIASTDIEYAYANSIYLEYSGANRTLYFYFIEKGTLYKKQVLKTSLNLVDGQTHTIVAKLSPAKISAPAGNNLGDLLVSRADVTEKTVYYQTWSIYIDGVETETKGIMPYYNSTYYWVRENGSSSIGQNPPSLGDTFMDNYIYCGINLLNAPIKLYGLEARAQSTSEYLK